MTAELIDLAIAAATDIAIEEAGKRQRWARILKALSGLGFFGLVAILVFVTFWYS